ncbi:nuclear protein UL4 [Equid alphaherpesvirus 3]|uniref:Nuclear protein UL4 n=1 Tax=Equid alphaherpesvirus 3 TaxID=80341 RepID=A0A077B621_9ALPH|nr:nuclear protein UL4 [Equid alphaherpesvirus 3]AIL02975.1 nuclear protein UL4 [Equid alphaherpesvirus 3]
MSGPPMDSAASPVTFITYALYGIKTSPAWTLPNFEQVLCGCEWGYRLIAVGGDSRCDVLPRGSFVVQHGAAMTAMVFDCGPEFCSYAFTHAGDSRVPLTAEGGSVLVVPFSGWVAVGRDRCLRSSSGGVATVSWDTNYTAYITIAVYRPSNLPSVPGSSGEEPEPACPALAACPKELEQASVGRAPETEAHDFLETILMESALCGFGGSADWPAAAAASFSAQNPPCFDAPSLFSIEK